MKPLMILALALSCAAASGAAAKTITYVETVTKADGTQIITITKVLDTSDAQSRRAGLLTSLLRSPNR